jgi:hypothetical protein
MTSLRARNSRPSMRVGALSPKIAARPEGKFAPARKKILGEPDIRTGSSSRRTRIIRLEAMDGAARFMLTFGIGEKVQGWRWTRN